jgi:hypothetical protein
MATKRSVRLLVVSMALLALGAAAATEDPGPRIELHWNKTTASSLAVVRNSNGDVLAETIWGGALPRRYSADEEEAELPILVFGQLREQLHASVQPEADEALAFVRELMDLHADTPVDALPPEIGTWVSYETIAVEEWCGTEVETDGECAAPASLSAQNAVCTAFACKKTVFSPEE